jgi:hypothetical protein
VIGYRAASRADPSIEAWLKVGDAIESDHQSISLIDSFCIGQFSGCNGGGAVRFAGFRVRIASFEHIDEFFAGVHEYF